MKKKLKVFYFIFFLFFSTVSFSLFPASYAESFERIISLAPGMTEILFAAGMEDKIAGVTTFCDYPEEAKAKPKIGGMSNPSLEAVVSLKPDIVVMTTDGNPKMFQQRLGSMNIKTFVFEALTLSELPDGIRDMGIALGEKEKFDNLALKIERSTNRFKKTKKTGSTKVLFIIWPGPLIAAGPGTAIDDAINLLGGINIAGDAKSRYPKYSLEEIFRRSPDIIFIGKGHRDMKKISSSLLKRLSHVPAVRNEKVFYVSDSLYRLGPRVVDGIEELAEYLEEKNTEH
ncbi:MAG: helical backbone metal receptor [Candidatus Mariimomonas ferrooxydans]